MKEIGPDGIARLRRLISYDPETGFLYWKPRDISEFSDAGNYGRSLTYQSAHQRKWNAKWAGKRCLYLDNGRGYLCGAIEQENYQSHRVAWAIFYGEWPDGHIDHINRIRSDNRIANLRLATPTQNQMNTSPKTGGYSPIKGVSWKKSTKRWVAQIRKNGKRTHLGYFATQEDAGKAYMAASITIHGEFSHFQTDPSCAGG